MGTALPFSKYNIEHYDIELLDAMRIAFHRICDALMLRCDRDDPTTEVIAEKIIAFAEAGGACPQRPGWR
jgi:hypothetical protein